MPGVTVHGRGTPRLPNTSSLSFEGIEGEALAINLDLLGIAVSTGSACHSTSPEPSRILAAMGIPAALNRATIRVSLGKGTTAAEVERFLALLPEQVERLRALSAPRRAG